MATLSSDGSTSINNLGIGGEKKKEEGKMQQRYVHQAIPLPMHLADMQVIIPKKGLGILKDRYLGVREGDANGTMETVQEMFWRVAINVANGSTQQVIVCSIFQQQKNSYKAGWRCGETSCIILYRNDVASLLPKLPNIYWLFFYNNSILMVPLLM
jgi:hypothetical protein